MSAAMVVVVVIVVLALGAGLIAFLPRRQSQDNLDWREEVAAAPSVSDTDANSAVPGDDDEEAWARFQAGGQPGLSRSH